MRCIVTAIVVALVAAGLSMLLASASYAEAMCTRTDPLTGMCDVWAQVPTQPGAAGQGGGPAETGTGSACYWDPAKQNLSQPPAGPVSCSSKFGYWSNADNCYFQLEQPQPEADDPAWQGHQPGDGAVYACYQPQTKFLVYVWLRTPPPGPGPTPGEVAQLAIKQMNLSAIDIGIAPRPGPDSVGLVGMPVWMWARNPGGHTFGPTTATASAGGITVTATARVFRVTWDMGDGMKVVCDSAGVPYLASYGREQSPECGHTYTKSSADQLGGKYTVTATSDWVVTWAGAGQTGTLRLDGLTRSTQITIGEAQVLVN